MLRRGFVIAGSICAAAMLLDVARGQTQLPPLPGPMPPRRPRAVEDHREGAPANQGVDVQLREGLELVDQPGSFKMAGDRVVFFLAGGKQQLIGLENLNLERIQRVLTDNTDPLEWFVSGSVTEFRGTNYLFVRRAMFKNRAAGTAPAPLVTPRDQRQGNPRP